MAAVTSTATSRTPRGSIGPAVEDDGVLTLKVEVEGFIAAPPERPSTLMRRLDAFEGLQARANLNRDVLQVHVQDLERTLAGLTASVETILNQKVAQQLL